MSWEIIRDSARARQAVVDYISNIAGYSRSELSELHRYISFAEVNRLRMHIYRQLNQNQEAKDLFYNLCAASQSDIVGGPVSYQVRLNVSIQIPGDYSSVLPAHCDSWAGDSPYQVNAWIPITDCESTASMFIVGREKSIEYLRRIKAGESLTILDDYKTYNFIEARAGDLVIFNGNYIHGNICNKTSKTRISVNYRFKSPWAPEYKVDFPDRSTPIYYELKLKIPESGTWNCYDKNYSDCFVDITHG